MVIAVMILNTMKILNFAWISLLLFSVMLSPSQGSDYDLEKIDTLTGRHFKHIRILGADAHGLMFRHAEGVAKVSFEELKISLREMFEPLPEEEQMFEEPEIIDRNTSIDPSQPYAGEEEIIVPDEKGGAGFVQGKISPPPVETASQTVPQDYAIDIIVRNRVVIPLPVNRGYGACDPCARPIHWPAHWGRYHPAHRLADPCFRELVVRDFLYTTGLMPLPPGVSVYRLPTSTPWHHR